MMWKDTLDVILIAVAYLPLSTAIDAVFLRAILASRAKISLKFTSALKIQLLAEAAYLILALLIEYAIGYCLESYPAANTLVLIACFFIGLPFYACMIRNPLGGILGWQGALSASAMVGTIRIILTIIIAMGASYVSIFSLKFMG